MLKRFASVAAVALFATAGLTACYDDADVTMFEPGVYKGPQDPLLGKLEEQELQNELEQRFSRAATDR